MDRILEAEKRGGGILAGVFQKHLGHGVQRLKAAIDAGRFGRLTLCSAYIKWWRDQSYYDRRGWCGTRAGDGGGALFNQGIHTIDLLQWIVGLPEEVVARVATLAHERIEVEDTAVALLKYSCGALGVIEGATSARPGMPSRIEISGDRGSAILENGRFILWKFVDERPGDADALSADENRMGSGASDPKMIGIEGHRLQIEDLAEAIRRGRSPAIPGAEGRQAVQLVRAIYEAAETGRPVRISR